MGVFMPFRQLELLRSFLCRVRDVEASRDFVGTGPPSSMDSTIENLTVSISYNLLSEPLMYLNRSFGDSPFQHQSMKINGGAYESLCDLLNTASEFIHKEAGTHFNDHSDKAHVMD